MKKNIFMLLLMVFLFPGIINASEIDYSLVSQSEKYYRTTYFDSNVSLYSSNNISHTEEISKEEYDNYNNNTINPRGNIVQTEYKKMTVQILENGTKYKYVAILEWKNMPKVRSYDTLAIGFYQSVKATQLSFNTYYCINNSTCYTQYNYYSKNSSTGVGATFELPTSTSITTLKHTLTVYVDKNVTDATIIEQKATADYAHATKTVTVSQAQNYNINTTGIHFQNNVSSYYDDISFASTTINCNW